MDPFTPELLQAGIRGFIGKGQRSQEVRRLLAEKCALYLVAIGGAGALIAQSIRQAQIVAYPDLGPEAIRQLSVVDFPAIVGCDSYGNDIYEIGQKEYRRKLC